MKYGLFNVYSTQALISREACFYNSMETRVREISCLPDLILKRKQNNFSTDDQIKEIQDEKGNIDRKNPKT